MSPTQLGLNLEEASQRVICRCHCLTLSQTLPPLCRIVLKIQETSASQDGGRAPETSGFPSKR